MELNVLVVMHGKKTAQCLRAVKTREISFETREILSETRNDLRFTCCKRNDEKLNASWFGAERLISKSIAPLEIQCVLTYDKPKLKHKLK